MDKSVPFPFGQNMEYDVRSFRFSRVIRRGSQRARRGLLTFEWVLIFAMLAVGVVGGLAAVRDALNTSYGSVAGAALGLDASYEVQEFEYNHPTGTEEHKAALSFTAKGMTYHDIKHYGEDGAARPAKLSLDGGRPVKPAVSFP